MKRIDTVEVNSPLDCPFRPGLLSCGSYHWCRQLSKGNWLYDCRDEDNFPPECPLSIKGGDIQC